MKKYEENKLNYVKLQKSETVGDIENLDDIDVIDITDTEPEKIDFSELKNKE